MDADELIAAGDRELADCAHRLVEWMIPMPDGVVRALRERGWIANPLIYMRHDGRPVPQDWRELVEVDYDAVLELREIWHREDFGDHTETKAFWEQAREVAELADVRVIAATDSGHPTGFAEVETHDGGSEITQVFVRPECRGAGLGRALTAHAIRLATNSAPEVWICAERDNRPRRLYQRLGFPPAATRTTSSRKVWSASTRRSAITGSTRTRRSARSPSCASRGRSSRPSRPPPGTSTPRSTARCRSATRRPATTTAPTSRSATRCLARPIDDPARRVVATEELAALVGCLGSSLSPLEGRVLTLYLEGRSYEEIGEIVECDPKAVDNALQRVKRKVGQHLDSRAVLDA